ncbi:trypsin-like serine peptidase [Sinorhizobium meliloti]|nr:serine protease [Sinorhizobium meliloti]
MTRHAKHLFNLFITLFRSNDDLYEAITSLDGGNMELLAAGLPGPNSTRIAFTLAAAQQLKAYGLDNAALFDELTRRFPARAALIAAVRREYLGGLAEETELSPSSPEAVPPTDVDIAAQEKIMGDRPTFLDVDYLAQGARTASAVVKLRMRFAAAWYSGTAFLVAPGRLLTAHHNLVLHNGQIADEVTAQFDYERAWDGPEPEGQVVPCRIDTIRGEAADDWAVIDLPAPQNDRPLVLFSETPAKAGDRVAIIQHPNGLVKQVALHNNLVTFADATRLQYLTDTLPGSSGAPVFDSRWRVVGLHHAGGDLNIPGTKQLVYRNQGISIGLVRDRLASHRLTPD